MLTRIQLLRICRRWAWLVMMSLVLLSCTASQVRMAEDLAAAGQWDEAVAIYRQAVKADPYDRDLVARLEEAKQEAAAAHYGFGRDYLAERQLPEALTELKLAMGYDPANRDYQAALADALRLKQAQDQLQLARKFQGMGRTDEALAIYERVVELDPSLTEALTGITTLTSQQRAAQSVGQSTKPITMRFQNAKLKEVFEIVARTANINVVFDKDIRDDPITIFLKDMSFDEALTLILNTNGLVSQKVGPDTLLILPNNKQKLAQYQDLMVRTFYLSNAKAKDAVMGVIGRGALGPPPAGRADTEGSRHGGPRAKDG